MTHSPLPLDDLQADLAPHADADKRAWWESYLKGEAEFRGVPTPDIRRLARAWWEGHDGDALPPTEQLEACLALVAFVNFAPSGAYAELIIETAEQLVVDDERFAQTGVAWVIRELGAARPGLTTRFLERHVDDMSPEARKQAMGRRRR